MNEGRTQGSTLFEGELWGPNKVPHWLGKEVLVYKVRTLISSLI